MSFDFPFGKNQIGSTVLAKQDSDVEDLDIYVSPFGHVGFIFNELDV